MFILLYKHKYIFIENWTHAIHRKREKVELDRRKFLFLINKYFIKKLFLSKFWISINFLFPQSTIFYMVYNSLKYM